MRKVARKLSLRELENILINRPPLCGTASLLAFYFLGGNFLFQEIIGRVNLEDSSSFVLNKDFNIVDFMYVFNILC